MKELTKDNVIEVLRTIYDPEIPVNIWDLGLIYDISISDSDVCIKMTFTSPTCPMMEDLLQQVKDSVESISAGREVKVELVWDPPWDLSRMSEEARLDLDLTEQGW